MRNPAWPQENSTAAQIRNLRASPLTSSKGLLSNAERLLISIFHFATENWGGDFLQPQRRAKPAPGRSGKFERRTFAGSVSMRGSTPAPGRMRPQGARPQGNDVRSVALRSESVLKSTAALTTTAIDLAKNSSCRPARIQRFGPSAHCVGSALIFYCPGSVATACAPLARVSTNDESGKKPTSSAS